ncbi:putative DNA-binding protein [Salirhabdus salicampi]|uniref:putative DNA-binding protein n=1 Tax=Salirhabdus salicampi TaxID=476102 RepID=UPI0020C1E21C|nr:putative DNA-binding protein [Salirhabdus salicampi]MCP8616549.1 putative DNA-binding protein [Salirhabdus salicampi]
MLEKTTRINYLFDFYQQLLTAKQSNYMEMYYLEDYSLGEIAESFNVSRQAVYDNIRRTETMLEEYEEKLLLYEKFQQRKFHIRQLRAKLEEDVTNKDELLAIVEQLEKLE